MPRQMEGFEDSPDRRDRRAVVEWLRAMPADRLAAYCDAVLDDELKGPRR